MSLVVGANSLCYFHLLFLFPSYQLFGTQFPFLLIPGMTLSCFPLVLSVNVHSLIASFARVLFSEFELRVSELTAQISVLSCNGIGGETVTVDTFSSGVFVVLSQLSLRP